MTLQLVKQFKMVDMMPNGNDRSCRFSEEVIYYF